VILGVQAALCIRLLRLNAAFVDEATYLYAGHQELDHWVHGWPIPSYPTYFSGAPTIYPPLAALVDRFGGLTGARLLSLVFMLATTAALWASAKRLFGRTGATAACALFASLGSTQALGAFATFDAMALMFLAIGAYCAIRAADASDDAHWWPLCATFLALANATKYTTVLWDPFVIAIMMILTRPRYGGNAMVRRAAGIAAFTSALLALGLAVGGAFYVTGITSTTVARAASTDSTGRLVGQVWHWIGWVVVFAVAGLIIAVIRRTMRSTDSALLAVLVLASIVAPLNQIRIHTGTSLQKHVDFGAWFACLAAGYAVVELARFASVRLNRTRLRNPVRLATSSLLVVGSLLLTAAPGRAQAAGFFHNWPSAKPVAEVLKRYVKVGNDQFLIEDYDVEAYYLMHAATWHQWRDTWTFSYYSHEAHAVISGLPAYADAVRNHYFSIIVLNYGDTAATDRAISTAMQSCPHQCGYHVVGQIPYTNAAWNGEFTIWQYEGAQH
jgi:hypothetical protein